MVYRRKRGLMQRNEKRWSRRWRDALSWFISNGNKVGISSSACLICEYAEHPTSDSSPLIKAWLGAQVAIAHLYENTWWWFYTQSSFTMEHVPEPSPGWEVHTVVIPQASPELCSAGERHHATKQLHSLLKRLLETHTWFRISRSTQFYWIQHGGIKMVRMS